MAKRWGLARTLLASVAALAALAMIASCGIPEDSGPEAIGEDQATVPLAETSTPPTADPSGEGNVTLFFVRTTNETDAGSPTTSAEQDSPRLRRVTRRTEATPGPADAVRLLLGGTTEEEANSDLVSAIPAETELMSDEAVGTVLTLGLSEEMSTIAGDAARQAFAQMVYTATQFSDVSAVAFLIDGDAVEVPADDADRAVVSPGDFTSLAPG